MHRKSKKILAGLLALATIAPMAVSMAPLTAFAEGQVLGETDFTYKALPWHTCESSPAKQNFHIEDGAFHVEILVADGAAGAKWDLQFRHRNLTFHKGHKYKISFKAKAKRDGMELCSKIGNTKGDKEYCDLKDGKFVAGPHGGGGDSGWGNPAKLSTEWKTFEGEWTSDGDYEAAEWAFHYANGTANNYGGNAVDGDEIWFDDMSIICETCGPNDIVPDGCLPDPNNHYGAVNRDYSGLDNNFISVNQIGYFPNAQKIAVLGDNAGDVLHDKTTISLSGTYTWELVNASSGSVVETGTTGTPFADKDSADKVAKIDFSKCTTPGRYYLRIQGEKWRSFEFNIGDDIYTDKTHNMLTNAINYFYQNRSGIDIESSYVTSGDKSRLAHQGGHKTDTADIQNAWVNEIKKTDATGKYSCGTLTANKGWYDAGDHGKYVVNGGIAVWTLQNMYERALYNDTTKAKFDDNSGTVVVPEAGNSVPDVLDECKYELDFIEDMKVSSSDSHWGKYEGLYYHKLHDHKWTGLATKPWDYEGPEDDGGWDTTRIVKPPTFAATLNFAACAAQAARLWEPYDSAQAATYLKEAKEAYQAYKKYWYEADHTKVTHPDLKCECEAEEINDQSLYAPMWHAKGGGPYGDNEVRDDGYWAACEIFTSAKALGDADADTYMTELSNYSKAFKVTTRIVGGENHGSADDESSGSYTSFNWGNTASAGSLTLALHKDYLSKEQAATLDASIVKAADDYISTETDQGYGVPYKYDGPGYNDPNNLDPSIMIYGYEWGSNSMVINNLIVMAYAYDQTQDQKYMDGVTQGMDYLLGTNPLAFSFITGYGQYKEQRPHHRYWSNELDPELPMAPDGVLSGGPNSGLQDPYVRALGFVPGKKENPSQRCFVDSIEAWSTNEVTINWNAPLAWIVEFLQDKDKKYDIPGNGGEVKKDWGNVDCSEGETPYQRVDVGDAVLLARYLAEDKSATVTDQGKLNADVNASGSPDSADTTKILQFVARLIDYDALGKA